MTDNYVSRAGIKLSAAMDAFGLSAAGKVCADFGCNVGGFTDCLLQRGAAKVYAIDTGYGALAWKLRKDSRVVVMERTNAIYCPVSEPVDLVTIDVAWTPQEMIVPTALRWLKDADSRIVALLKPHYEWTKLEGRPPAGTLSWQEGTGVVARVCQRLSELGATCVAIMPSTIEGKGGNREFLLLLRAAAPGGTA